MLFLQYLILTTYKFSSCRLTMTKFLLYFHSARHLKFIQIFNRITRKFKPIDSLIPEVIVVRDNKEKWMRVEILESSSNGKESFRFLNQTGNIGNWNDPIQSKLWLYNLHYFDDLNAKNAKARGNQHFYQIDKWINDNPVFIGNGWEPYPLSLRIVNWIKYFISFENTSYEFNSSLYLQSKVLYQSIEYHLLGNHIFANAKALVFAGCYFSGDEPQKWLDKGLDILYKQVHEQVLSDGGNFELSPMYHNILLEDMLDLVNLANTYKNKQLLDSVLGWKNIIEKMLNYSSEMSHPDGEVAFFNDSAMKIAPTIKDLKFYASIIYNSEIDLYKNNVDFGKQMIVSNFSNSGYITVKSKNLKSILDVAKVGPDYIPGHAHADTLSFELSLFDQRVFVNSGTGEYGLSEERSRQRKTCSHNTVEVDFQDSSEVWSGFRVARRANTFDLKVDIDKDDVSVSCSHDGYKRLPGAVLHNRTWFFSGNIIEITDHLTGSYQVAFAYYHIHPSVDVKLNGNIVVLTLPNSKVVTLTSDNKVKLEETSWHPEFGLSIKNKKLVLAVENSIVKLSVRY